MSQNNDQQNDDKAADNTDNSAHNHPVVGPWTGKLREEENELMKHATQETQILNYANPEDPNAPRQIINKGNSR